GKLTEQEVKISKDLLENKYSTYGCRSRIHPTRALQVR
ncbi:unnamed protein product, partial [marine sediment metagenome]